MTTSAIVGYARTSTRDQQAGLHAQLAELGRAGCSKVFTEQVSSVRVAQRRELERALEYVREGDVFVVTKIDRLARSLPHLLEIIGRLQNKGVSLRILSMAIDTATPQGKLMLSVMGGVAQFERELMLERQADGIAAAKAAGKYKGRVPTAQRKSAEIRSLSATGLSRAAVAQRVGVSVASVYRVLQDARAADTR
jgi:DNA invertase Pin-like site-specific DNA recombinase